MSADLGEPGFGTPLAGAGTHTRENTIDDLEIVPAGQVIDVSKPRRFTKLGDQHYLQLLTPVPDDQNVPPTTDPNATYIIPQSDHNNGYPDTSSPLIEHSYHSYNKHRGDKKHKTYESNDISYSYANIVENGHDKNEDGSNGYHSHHSYSGYTNDQREISKSKSTQKSAMSIEDVMMNATQTNFDWAPKATILSSIINLCNSIVGAAILGLPYAASEVGWLNAVILLAICSIVSQFTFQLQTSAGIIYNNSTQTLSSSYYNLSKVTIPKLAIISDIVIAVSCLGAATSYLIIIGDNMPRVSSHFFKSQGQDINDYAILKNRRFWISMYMACLIIPTVLPRKLDALKYSSALAIIFFGLITISMTLYVFDEEINECNADDADCGITAFHPIDFNFGKAIPIYFFAYGSHPLGFAMTNELLNSNFSRMNVVSSCSFTLTAILYIIVSILGYFTFGDDSQSNILNNYPENNLVSVCRIGLSIAVAFSYPVLMTPSRHCISTALFGRNASQINAKKFYLVTIGAVCLTFTIAMIVDDLGIVMGFIGSTSAPISILILPGLYYYFILRNTDEIAINIRSRWIAYLNIYGSIVVIIIGIVLIPFCLVILFI